MFQYSNCHCNLRVENVIEQDTEATPNAASLALQ